MSIRCRDPYCDMRVPESEAEDGYCPIHAWEHRNDCTPSLAAVASYHYHLEQERYDDEV